MPIYNKERSDSVASSAIGKDDDHQEVEAVNGSNMAGVHLHADNAHCDEEQDSTTAEDTDVNNSATTISKNNTCMFALCMTTKNANEDSAVNQNDHVVT
ncbi:hypothetical protein AB205_0005970 [Aquarana catesbeiana]|uniref:Uncharacterized protein n=1 Tax=Aquarana catesbeiana TaxID=8400 RepID=A0A2G9S0A7_AQUCT|nr:hypothetical protein AB205_0005970 [Aquarana catesbeiana]